MPDALAYVYTNQTRVERLLSAVGVSLRMDDDGDGTVESGVEEDSIDDCMYEATADINQYLIWQHTPAILNTSEWVWAKCTVIAAYYLCCRRGNPVPDSLQDRFDKVIDDLERAAKDGVKGLPYRLSKLPAISNVGLDPRYRYAHLRLRKGQSSEQASTQKRNVDHREGLWNERLL